MTLLIVSVILISLLLIATDRITNINKAAIAIFAGTVSWILYICWGSDYVMSQHSGEYISWLDGANATSIAVKEYIASNIFLRHVGRSAEIVLFLLSTMTIVEVLNNNGCFDFIAALTRTRQSHKYVWLLSIITLLISANLDNLTTTIMMLVVMMKTVNSHRWRLIYGTAIVISANFGGAISVIGEPSGLLLWNMGTITASGFFLKMIIPSIVAWATTIFLLGRMLPENLDSDRQTLPYRGDDTNLNLWQRVAMLIVGIGGLWFIPTFHNITKLSPFLGALCVLSILWIVNEIFNRHIIKVDKMISRKTPYTLQYGIIQMNLYVMGMMLAIGVIQEIGVTTWVAHNFSNIINNVWIMGVISGVVSMFIDNFTTILSFFSFHDMAYAQDIIQPTETFTQDGIYWSIITYATTLGGCLLGFGSICGLAFFKMERVPFGWYLKTVTPRLLLGGAVGFAIMFLMA